MNNEIRAAMYGKQDKKKITEDKSNNVVASTKIETSKGGMARVKSGNDQVIVPTQDYMKDLDKRLDAIERAIKRLESQGRQTSRIHNQVKRELNNIRTDLNGKLDIRD